MKFIGDGTKCVVEENFTGIIMEEHICCISDYKYYMKHIIEDGKLVGRYPTDEKGNPQYPFEVMLFGTDCPDCKERIIGCGRYVRKHYQESIERIRKE
jgi:hypothetical protein